MAKTIKCLRFGCGSTNVQLLGGKTKTTLNLDKLAIVDVAKLKQLDEKQKQH